MITEVNATSLAYYVRSLGKVTETAFLGQLGCPVLVEGARVERDAGGPSTFRTEFIGGDARQLRCAPLEKREVALVKKRPGAAFSGHISVGRTPNLDICLARSGVSKFHAYFHEFEGGFLLTDKDSTNGTFMDGSRLIAGGTVTLKDGCEVRFDAHRFAFMTPQSFFRLLRSL